VFPPYVDLNMHAFYPDNKVERWMEKLEESETKVRVLIKGTIVTASLMVSSMIFSCQC
jgi:hypothetical protein